jgi:hypothetical protein
MIALKDGGTLTSPAAEGMSVLDIEEGLLASIGVMGFTSPAAAMACFIFPASRSLMGMTA